MTNMGQATSEMRHLIDPAIWLKDAPPAAEEIVEKLHKNYRAFQYRAVQF